MLRVLALTAAVSALPPSAHGFSIPVRVAELEPAAVPVDEVHAAGSADGILAAAWGIEDRWGAPSDGPLTLAVSTDRGRSWQPSLVPGVGHDPLVAVAPDGAIEVLWRDRFWVEGRGRVFHVRTADLGRSWSEPRLAAFVGSSWSQGWQETAIAVSPLGRIALGGPAATNTATSLFFYDPALQSWSDETVVDGLGGGMPALAWLSDADLLLCSPAGDEVRCRASSDGGRTFGAAVVATRSPDARLTARIELAVRGPGDVVLGATVEGALWVVRSTDGGLGWSDAAVLSETPWYTIRPSLAAHPGGEVWLTSGSSLWSTADGVSWREVPTPADLTCLGGRSLVLAPAWRTPVLVAGPHSWTASATLGWERARSIAPARQPVSDLRLVRTASGRLVAAWRQGRELPRPVFSSYSDDGGASWSSPAPVSDGLPSLGAEDDGIAIDAVATVSGGAAILWHESDAGGCASIHLSRSADGARFEPGPRLAETSDARLSIAEDGDGTLVALWLERDPLAWAWWLDRLVAARSTDGGQSWSVPAVVLEPASIYADLEPAELARAADGSLVALALDTDGYASQLAGARSSDGGATWTRFALTPTDGPASERLALVAAGPRLFATVWGQCGLWGCGLTATFVSDDRGQSWSGFTPLVPAEPSLTGDVAGNLYWHADGKVETLLADGSRLSLGPLASDGAAPALLAFAPGDVGALHADLSGAFRAPALLFSRNLCSDVTIESSSPSQLVCDGTLDLSVTASGGPDLTYQWHRGGQPIPGAVEPGYSVAAVTPADQGAYLCVVTDGCSVVSAPAVVTLGARPPPLGNGLMVRRAGSQLLASWDPVHGATSCSVYRGTDPAGDFPSHVTTESGIATRATFAAPSGNLVLFRVAAKNDCGLGPK